MITYKRREFLKTAAVAVGGLGLINTLNAVQSGDSNSTGFFGVHPFVEEHPEAVFIMRTHVDVKTNNEAKKQAGHDFGRSVIVPKIQDQGGIPLSHKVVIKPNITDTRFRDSKFPSFEGRMGIITDPYFVEGVIESMKALGIPGNQFYVREVSTPDEFGITGYNGMCRRTGADIRDLAAPVGKINKKHLQWVDVPDGVFFRKIPYLWPVNTLDTWLLNIAKFKTHGMGLTLTSKNIQGAIAHNYQRHCSGFNTMRLPKKHLNPKALKLVKGMYERHLAQGVPRWDKSVKSYNSGLGMEMWAARCIDNNFATKTGLHVIEGIYGRDGNFSDGPNDLDGNFIGGNHRGVAKDHMCNTVMFGKNNIHVDIVGHWLGGHEPGNFGLFHQAKDRGMSTYLNPADIPVYEWNAKNGTAVLAKLTDFERTPLRTRYLRRNYKGGNEEIWHLCNEPYDY